MPKEIHLTKWAYDGDRVKLEYSDGDIVYITRKDFKRAFMCISSLTKEEVIRDFGIKENDETE